MKEIDWANLSFGYMKTDYNVRINFRNGAWGELEVSSDEHLNLHMAATCLHYGQEAFEGLKAFRGKDGKVRIFRLEENAARLQSTCQGILMAELPTERFKEAILKVVKLNERFIPPYETGASLYIRPLLIGTSTQVGVHPAEEYMFVVFVTPVGPYFKGGFSTNPYVIIREFDRAAPHGTGIYKVGGNYAASLRVNKKAHDLGYSCELNALIYCNQKELYSLFFHAVAETVMELSGDPAHMGGTPGFISIMHTWGSNLSYHPHIHVLCTGGGLDADRNWHQKKGGFFLPGKAMAALFKGKFLSGLKALHEAGNLSYEGAAAKYRNQYEYQELLDICYGKNWVTDIRESFAGAETVMHYLGRYTHRIAVSNSRILRMDENTVTIKVKDYKSGGQWKELTLDGVEFVRRFLMHVPPKGFVRIRHYGILSNQNKRKLIPICRNLIGCREFLRRFRKDDKAQAIRILYKKDVTVCPCCGGAMSYEVCTEWTPKRSSA